MSGGEARPGQVVAPTSYLCVTLNFSMTSNHNAARKQF